MLTKEVPQTGKLAYTLFNQVFFLENSRRQRNDEELDTVLASIREGKAGQPLLNIMVERQFMNMTLLQKQEFEQHDTVYAFAKNSDADEKNMRYLKENFQNVIYIKQTISGKHASTEDGNLSGASSQIPKVLAVAVGCLVRLKKIICSRRSKGWFIQWSYGYS